MNDKRRDVVATRLANASWGAFLLWVGICLLAGFSWDVGLLGVAVITLLTQAIRASARLEVEGFWVAVGCFFAGAGLLHVFGVGADVGPIAIMATGAAMLLLAIFGTKRPHAD